jgi:dGTPase
MQLRESLENKEDQYLAPYAVRSSQSKGRLYEVKKDSYRTEFQRDRDRIVHSKAFRRLKHKTQVFYSPESDHYRTRLTHTLEVAQIARQIARNLNVNEDLTECIALAHDLGHTPFGHTGEIKLNELMLDFGGFEHNRQSKRLVEYLETKYPEHHGLNLSLDVLEGLMKHQAPYENNQGNGLDIIYPSLEAQIVNIADEIAYVTHDLDDGLSSSFLKFEDLDSNCSLWQEVEAQNKKVYSSLSFYERQFMNVRQVISRMVVDVISQSSTNLKAFGLASLEDVYAHSKQIVNFSAAMRMEVDKFEALLLEKFYKNEVIESYTQKGTKNIEVLFGKFMQKPELLPESEYNKIDTETLKARLVSDYIASMTDNFAIKEVVRLVG